MTTASWFAESIIALEGIPSAEAFGEFGAAPGAVHVVLQGIPSEEAFGEINVTTLTRVALEGIPSAEAFGDITVTTLTHVALQGIPSAEAFGEIAVHPGPVTVALQGIPSAEAFGSIEVVQFTAFNEENIARTNQPVPQGTDGCWVTLIGGGGTGGPGGGLNTWGGRGGGGGAKIARYFIPRDLLGDTYSVAVGAAGVASSFSSDGKSLTAGPGVYGSSGGTCTVVGYTGVTTLDGVAGGYAGSSGSNANGAGAGGGYGGYSYGFQTIAVGRAVVQRRWRAAARTAVSLRTLLPVTAALAAAAASAGARRSRRAARVGMAVSTAAAAAAVAPVGAAAAAAVLVQLATHSSSGYRKQGRINRNGKCTVRQGT